MSQISSHQENNKEPLVEIEVRRSPRIQNITEGFKRNSCPNKNCLVPVMPAKNVKILSSYFCKI
jgi:hypothetical protein